MAKHPPASKGSRVYHAHICRYCGRLFRTPGPPCGSSRFVTCIPCLPAKEQETLEGWMRLAHEARLVNEAPSPDDPP